ncbi:MULTISPECIES: hypothetical protein [unclassified Flavobacterium]|uniref:hypothetical protein n=1 Tax=unclassified Flavobacterium TaxID=196869 RepID=UPI0009605FD0|nr:MULTISPECIES: hypothetical protein [unclassified Flavobacterium]MBN9283918.1 hypothetical protein [Flavobacterium sp.]OJV73422.1 MAG: hypothetical protein BGO42_09690 [Flavobacterium sp. 40-81]
MKHRTKFILFLLFSFILSYSQVNIYVSPNGLDTNNGLSVETAVKNIKKGKEIARGLIGNTAMTNDIVVNILPGEYVLNETLVFDSNDGGNNGYYIIYKAFDSSNKPTITGGQKITGWLLHDPLKNIWKATINSGLFSRQLYVNGVKAFRARSEDNFNLFETTNGYFSTCNDFSTWENVKDLEIVSCINWKTHRIPVESVCKNRLVINSAFWEFIHLEKPFKSAPVRWLENSYNLIDKENEWFIDKANHVVYYKPSNAITTQNAINGLNIIIPKLEKLIDCRGTNEANVRNIKFIDLNFCYTTWNKPSELNTSTNTNYGFSTNYGADDTYPVQIPGAIAFIYSKNIYFIKNSISHIGSTGLSFLVGSSNNVICNNRVEDISGSGIYLGDYLNWPDPCKNPDLDPAYYAANCIGVNHNSDLLENNQITNNLVSNVANEYYSCSGINVSFARQTIVNQNTVTNFPYTGISFGWGSNRYIDHGINNKIINNKVDCYAQFMGDGGGIYTLSNLGNSTNRAEISHNYILNQTSYLGAIYLDQASSNIDIHDNVIDIQPSVIIPETKQCIDNIVRAINCPTSTSALAIIYRSYNVSIYNNYYNNRYSLLSNVNYDSAMNINYNNNYGFVGFLNHSQNSIIMNSGQQSNFNCN